MKTLVLACARWEQTERMLLARACRKQLRRFAPAHGQWKKNDIVLACSVTMEAMKCLVLVRQPWVDAAVMVCICFATVETTRIVCACAEQGVETFDMACSSSELLNGVK